MAQVILITSGKGGTGKSTVCAGLGISLARLGHRVLLAEGGRRSLDVQFGLDETVLFDRSDLAQGRCEKGDALLALPGQENLRLLCGPLEAAAPADTAFCRRLAAGYGPLFDFILVDVDGLPEENLAPWAAIAQRAVLVCTPERAGARLCRQVSDFLAAQGMEDIRLCVNMLPDDFSVRRTVPDLDWMIDNICAQLIAVIPLDRELFCGQAGVRDGLPNIPRLIFDHFAQRILGKYIDLWLQ